MSVYVIVATAADGTLTVWGTANGSTFYTKKTADQRASELETGGFDTVAVHPLLRTLPLRTGRAS